MQSDRSLTKPIVRAAVPALLAILAIAATAGADPTFEKILADKGPALVTIKFVMKMEGGYGSHEAELEIDGLLVDPKGLVLTNSRIAGAGGSSGRMTPTDIKVLYGGDTEGVEAKLLTKDSELDLAWLKIKKPPEKPYDYIDLSKTGEPKLGDSLITMRRLDKFFDRAPVLAQGRVAGFVEKPRKLMAPSIDLYAGPGAPVFMPDGRLAGIMVMQRPDQEDSTGRSSGDRMILPADRVAKATERALETAAEEEEEEEDEPADDAKAPASRPSVDDPKAEKASPEKEDGE